MSSALGDARGSTWNRWDLHVHTPSSLVRDYTGSDDIWERFIVELESLPSEFKVLGINDYLFLDGYKKIVDFRRKGRLENIECVLPVLEFRLSAFAGTRGKFSRVNYHVIFSDELESKVIEQQFLSQLSASFSLEPGSDGARWDGVLSRSSLKDLGAALIETVPETERHRYGSPLIEGFNNLTTSVEAIHKALGSHYFDGQYLTAVGKTEWADVKWTESSIAVKKSLINTPDLIFISAKDKASYDAARGSLRAAGVNDKLMDCSDAHTWSSREANKDRIGNSLLWLKARPSFRGLQHATIEFDRRVYVGLKPAKLRDMEMRPSKYIDTVDIRKVDKANVREVWFSQTVPLNPGLVAIVGNKGSGKSALADIIALGANSHRKDDFSFLTPGKFCQPRNDKSRHFQSTLRWLDGEETVVHLNDESDLTRHERVTYLPQSYLEKLCNEIAGTGSLIFARELESVIFTHIPLTERAGAKDLGSLLSATDEVHRETLEHLRQELRRLNRRIASLEAKLDPSVRSVLVSRLADAERRVSALKQAEPAPVPSPDANDQVKTSQTEVRRHTAELRSALEKLRTRKSEAEQSLASARTAQASVGRLRGKLESLESRVHKELVDIDELWERVGEGDESPPLVSLAVDWDSVEKTEARIARTTTRLAGQLDAEQADGITRAVLDGEAELAGLQEQLDAPSREYESYLAQRREWSEALTSAESDVENPDSVASITEHISELDEVPDALEQLEAQRHSLAMELYGSISEMRTTRELLYQPVQDFIERHSGIAGYLSLSFDVRIESESLVERLSSWLHAGRSGSFYGAQAGSEKLSRLVAQYDFTSSDDISHFMEALLSLLKRDDRDSKAEYKTPGSQLKHPDRVSEFYDFLYGLEYLVPRYSLSMDEKELGQLSPGERGLLLLLFYLLIDTREQPLIIDQPEENLDNETVHEVLVPAISDATQRRQIIIVTHNPNLAVVADADQVIRADIDKTGENRVSYEAGCLEDPQIAQHVLVYLEGTRPAFMKRHEKYQLSKS